MEELDDDDELDGPADSVLDVADYATTVGWLRIDEVARRVNRSGRTIKRWMASGLLPYGTKRTRLRTQLPTTPGFLPRDHDTSGTYRVALVHEDDLAELVRAGLPHRGPKTGVPETKTTLAEATVRLEDRVCSWSLDKFTGLKDRVQNRATIDVLLEDDEDEELDDWAWDLPLTRRAWVRGLVDRVGISLAQKLIREWANLSRPSRRAVPGPEPPTPARSLYRPHREQIKGVRRERRTPRTGSERGQYIADLATERAWEADALASLTDE